MWWLGLGLVVVALVAEAAGGAKVHRNHGKFTAGPWKPAHATFYGGRDGSGTLDGACGYKDTSKEGYGVQTVA
uniref:Expansin-like EG45 domain-containing protein n=2 Tax=Oryza brachyantha TaxID=4533 RepID=J3MVC6_ORYBR